MTLPEATAATVELTMENERLRAELRHLVPAPLAGVASFQKTRVDGEKEAQPGPIVSGPPVPATTGAAQ